MLTIIEIVLSLIGIVMIWKMMHGGSSHNWDIIVIAPLAFIDAIIFATNMIRNFQNASNQFYLHVPFAVFILYLLSILL